jgi:glycosyltransferase involved in cell wall biosynthesis
MLRTGIVVIGRNEGARLLPALEAARATGAPVVYVDSASQDGSAALARSLGCDVAELDPSRPLSAARARNEGFARLEAAHPGLEAVQFVDGDCVLAPGWLDRARETLGARPDAAVCCGRLREERPDASVYNRLCDLEWNGPLGEIEASGGIALVRAEPFRRSGGFNAALAGGEEPELCRRLRGDGWKVLRIEAEMGRHDADLTRFGQWWRRSVRGGFGAAQIASLGDGPARRRNASALAWALLLPLAVLAAAWPTRGLSTSLLGLYPLLALKVAAGRARRGDRWGAAFSYGVFCVLGKAPHLAGWLRARLGGGRP